MTRRPGSPRPQCHNCGPGRRASSTTRWANLFSRDVSMPVPRRRGERISGRSEGATPHDAVRWPSWTSMGWQHAQLVGRTTLPTAFERAPRNAFFELAHDLADEMELGACHTQPCTGCMACWSRTRTAAAQRASHMTPRCRIICQAPEQGFSGGHHVAALRSNSMQIVSRKLKTASVTPLPSGSHCQVKRGAFLLVSIVDGRFSRAQAGRLSHLRTLRSQ